MFTNQTIHNPGSYKIMTSNDGIVRSLELDPIIIGDNSFLVEPDFLGEDYPQEIVPTVEEMDEDIENH